MEACPLPTSASLPRALPIPFGHLRFWTVTFSNNTLHVMIPIQRLHELSLSGSFDLGRQNIYYAKTDVLPTEPAIGADSRRLDYIQSI